MGSLGTLSCGPLTSEFPLGGGGLKCEWVLVPSVLVGQGCEQVQVRVSQLGRGVSGFWSKCPGAPGSRWACVSPFRALCGLEGELLVVLMVSCV